MAACSASEPSETTNCPHWWIGRPGQRSHGSAVLLNAFSEWIDWRIFVVSELQNEHVRSRTRRDECSNACNVLLRGQTLSVRQTDCAGQLRR